MVNAVQKPVEPVKPTRPDTDRAITVLSKALRQKREEAAALVRLIEQSNTLEDKGQFVNYRA